MSRRDGKALGEIGLPATIVEPRATLSDALNEMLTARYSCAAVIDAAGDYRGVLDIDTINEAVRSMRRAERGRLQDEYPHEEEVPS